MELVSVSPQRPSDTIVAMPEAGADQIRLAVARGRGAQLDWAATPAPMRAAALNVAAERLAERSDAFIDLGVREVGKPRTEMSGEVTRAISILRYYAQQVLDPDGFTFPSPDGQSNLTARRRPHGVAALITPWNFPLAIPLWKAAPAIAFGNAVVLKPAPQALATALKLGELLAGCLPDGLFQVVAGDAEAGAALVHEADIVSFTGSEQVGQAVVVTAASAGHLVQAEMGGQNTSIVLPDADLERAASAIALAAMSYAGQKCTATSRIIVVGDPAEFTEALSATVIRLSVGDPADQSTVVGPVIDIHAEKVIAAVDQAVSRGGRVVVGGSAIDRDGFFVSPTIVDRVHPDSTLSREEVFGPVAALFGVDNVDDAIVTANSVRQGLAAAVFTAISIVRWTSRLD